MNEKTPDNVDPVMDQGALDVFHEDAKKDINNLIWMFSPPNLSMHEADRMSLDLWRCLCDAWDRYRASQSNASTNAGLAVGRAEIPQQGDPYPGVNDIGIKRIEKERARQLTEEHFGPSHDDGYTTGYLALAAVAYAAGETVYIRRVKAGAIVFKDAWPFCCKDKRSGVSYENIQRPMAEPSFVKDAQIELISKRIRDLEKAGALVAAEIDRLLRMRIKLTEDEK